MTGQRPGVGIGLFFVAAGVLFLLEALDVLRLRAAYLWPVLLIGFGAALLIGGIRRRRAPEPSAAPAAVPPGAEPPEEPRPPEERPADEDLPPPGDRPADEGNGPERGPEPPP